MTSQTGYLKLLITRSILSGPLDFEIESPVVPFFKDLGMSWPGIKPVTSCSPKRTLYLLSYQGRSFCYLMGARFICFYYYYILTEVLAFNTNRVSAWTTDSDLGLRTYHVYQDPYYRALDHICGTYVTCMHYFLPCLWYLRNMHVLLPSKGFPLQNL